MKGSIKERWGKLTDGDVDIINGQNLVGKIQEKYGIEKKEAQQVDDGIRMALAKLNMRDAARVSQSRKRTAVCRGPGLHFPVFFRSGAATFYHAHLAIGHNNLDVWTWTFAYPRGSLVWISNMRTGVSLGRPMWRLGF